MDPEPTLNWVFEYQLSPYKRAESNLLAGHHILCQVVVWVIHLYLLIYCRYSCLKSITIRSSKSCRYLNYNLISFCSL